MVGSGIGVVALKFKKLAAGIQLKVISSLQGSGNGSVLAECVFNFSHGSDFPGVDGGIHHSPFSSEEIGRRRSGRTGTHGPIVRQSGFRIHIPVVIHHPAEDFIGDASP